MGLRSVGDRRHRAAAVYDFMPDVQLGRTADAALSPVPRLVVNISARHIHLNREAMDVLFGLEAN